MNFDISPIKGLRIEYSDDVVQKIKKRQMATETKVQLLGANSTVDINNLARFAVEEQNKREVLSIFLLSFFSSFKSTSLPKNQLALNYYLLCEDKQEIKVQEMQTRRILRVFG